MNISLQKKLESLTDEEAANCLNVLLHGLTIENQDFARLLETREDLQTVIQAAADNQTQSTMVENLSAAEQAKAVRLLLLELSDRELFGSEMEAWIDGGRQTLLVPLAVPLVLAGIVLVLSTDIKIEYKNEDGKKKFVFKLQKSATSEKILSKFFGLFGVS